MPVADHGLTQQLIGHFPALLEGGAREGAGLHYPRQRHVQVRHELWEGRSALAVQGDAAVILQLRDGGGGGGGLEKS